MALNPQVELLPDEEAGTIRGGNRHVCWIGESDAGQPKNNESA